MKFGVGIPNYGETLNVETLRSIALEAENFGYDSLWTTDHILMPRDSRTPYEKIFDSISTLAYLAPQTRSIRLGISSLIIAMRNPAVVAKQLASIDSFSGGRVMLAIGAGWNEQEFGFLGSDFHTRGRRVDESIKLIRSLWAGNASFKSRYAGINFENGVFEPRPPSAKPTIWIGGTSKAAMKRAAELGDAWHPNAFPLEEFRQLVGEFRQVSPKATDADICVRIGLNTRATQSEYVGPRGEKRILLSGNMAENRQILSELESLGVSYAVLVTSADGKAGHNEQVESLRSFAKEFL